MNRLIAPKERILMYVAENRGKRVTYLELKRDLFFPDDSDDMEFALFTAIHQYSDVLIYVGKPQNRKMSSYLKWIGTEDEAEAVIYSS